MDTERYVLDLIDGHHERTERRLWRTVAALLVLLALTVGGCAYAMHKKDQKWLDYLSQYDFSAEITEVQQDGEGVNICGNGNGVSYGAENQENHQEADR